MVRASAGLRHLAGAARRHNEGFGLRKGTQAVRWPRLSSSWWMARLLLTELYRRTFQERTEKTSMKKLKLAVLLSAFAASGAALAQADAAAAAEPASTLSFNVGAVTDYRYRGISQSRLRPALQGGIDFAHKSGFYVGTWASTIQWIKDAGGNSDVEIDLYGGYKTSFSGVGIDVGALRYYYPNNKLAVNADTTELYLAGSWGPATLKWSHAVTNLFGFADSDGSDYLDLSGTFDLPWYGLTLTPHIGRQRIEHNASFSYTDWSLAVGKDFGKGLSASLAYVDTNAATSPLAYPSPSGKNLGRAGLVAGIKYAF
jgi:uncharacterized protein (TIGR02001 family)